MIYAVIDTNVLVSALLSRHSDAATVTVIAAISEDGLRPLFNQGIVKEYDDVLHRPKFGFPPQEIDAILHRILKTGVETHRTKTSEMIPDPKDVEFYEVALSKDDAFLVTGNTKHFPKNTIVVTPAEMVEILKKAGII